MRQPFRLEDPSPTLQDLKTHRLIADIECVVAILSADIAEEEAATGVFDSTRAEYPILARVLAARRENLRSTIASLRQRMDVVMPTAA